MHWFRGASCKADGKREKMDIIGSYEEKPFPKSRDVIVDALEEGVLKHYVHALIEVDVTKAREYIRNYKKMTGESLSFTGWMIKCIAQAVSEHKIVNAYREGRRKLIIFDDVDISVVVDRSDKGGKIPLLYVVRRANDKNVEEIHDEIRGIQAENLDDNIYFIDENMNKNVWTMKLAKCMPKCMRKLVWQKLKRDAFFAKKTKGTVM